MEPDLIKTITDLVLRELNLLDPPDLAPVGISGRHVHLSHRDLDILFGTGYTLTKKKDLSMRLEFAAEETVTLVGPNRRSLENVRILGPLRKQTQIEISRTDAVRLGVNPPVRASGDLSGSAPMTLVGPKGAIYLPEGCILANRHIHFGPEDASRYQIKQNELVDIEVSGEKGGILRNVQCRIKDTYTLELHLDTDDANAFGLRNGDLVTILRRK